ncbi:MAG: bifunctional folylpolyglutamate synthase/dihydrofolate synthase [Acidobacteriota bacterium]
MNHAESLAYLERLTWFGIKAGLDHTRTLCRRLGHPERAFPSVLVAGTNGKGSTAAFLEAILRASGRRTGLYTSPHLVDVRERIRVDGAAISPDGFARVLSEVREAAENALKDREVETDPTYFEALTLTAFLHFRGQGVDAAVLEVGLGGRLDCTNVAPAILCAVTNVGMDHEEHLGPGLLSIAREKAGIFRPGVPALTGARGTWALRILRQEARRRGTRLGLPDWSVEKHGDGWHMAAGTRHLDLPYPALPGEHQLGNAALAVRCAWELDECGFAIPDQAIRRGILEARWPGRLELVGREPDVYLDGAHNLDGCEVLARFVAELPHPRKALVFAVMRDKPVADMASRLFPLFGKVWATSVPMGRCLDPAGVRAAWPGELEEMPDPAAALKAAAEWSGREGVVVAAGSLYLVGYLLGLSRPEGSLNSWGSGL